MLLCTQCFIKYLIIEIFIRRFHQIVLTTAWRSKYPGMSSSHFWIGPYRYHELRLLISYFPCHWVVPDDFPNTCPLKIVRIFYWFNARCWHEFYTLTRSFPNHQWYNKSTYDLVESLLSLLSFYRQYVEFKERYSDMSKFQMAFKWV